jgi:hypothetical protein
MDTTEMAHILECILLIQVEVKASREELKSGMKAAINSIRSELEDAFTN